MTKRYPSHSFFCFFLFCAIVLGGAVRADNPEESVKLTPLEVTGTRLIDPPFEQPYAFYRTSAAELDQRVGRTALDRFNYGPGVFIQRTAPNQASPFIRGLTGEQALLMLDGVRFNHAMMRPGPNQYASLIPGMSVRGIDAILGSSSVVNGSDGLTGGLDYRLATAGRGVAETTSPWLAGRADSGNGGTLEGGVDGVSGDWAYSVEASGALFHDRVGGNEFRDRIFGPGRDAYDSIPNTAYDEMSAALRLAYYGVEGHVMELKAGHTRQTDAPRPGGYFENSGKESRRYRYFDPQSFSYLHLRDQWELGANAVDRLQTTLWWHQFGEEQFRSSFRNLGDADQRIRQREYDDTLNAYGADIQATTLWGDGETHELIWGGTFIYETTDNSYREFRTPGGSLDPALLTPHRPEDWANKTSVSDGSEYTTVGLYAQDNWELSPSFSLLTGARFSRMDWSFGEVDGDASDVTGSLRGLWRATESHHLFAGVSKGFRAPNLKNLDGVVDRGSSGQAAQGNPELDPEISYTTEGGWKWQRGRDQAQVTVFQTIIDELIQRDFSGDGTFTNVEGADLTGFESAWDLEIGFLSGNNETLRVAFVGSVSLVDATRDIPVEGGGTVEDNISRANRLYGRAGLRVESGANWWGMAQVRWHDDYDDVASHPSDSDSDDIRLTVPGDPDGSMDGYAVADLMVGWQSDEGDVEVGFFLENIADETYRAPGSGTDGTGRSFGMTGRLRF